MGRKLSVLHGAGLLFVLVFCFFWTEVQASDRGIVVNAKTQSGENTKIELYSGYYALVIGAGEYTKGWTQLPSPVKDAREVAGALRDMGWEVDVLEDPESSRLRRALNTLIAGPGQDPSKAILVWFSGHGHTLEEADGSKLGYIVPVDAPNPDHDLVGFMDKAINMRHLETVSKQIKSKHVLMAFDSCFSGAVFQVIKAKPSPYIQEKIAYPVREFLTAGSEDETVPDRSIFKTVFLQAVTEGFGDTNKDSYVTGEELGAYVQEKVINYTRKAQQPQFGKINNPILDKGDFVFLAGGSDLPAKTGSLLIWTEPEGAVVYVDGTRQGQAPAKVSGLKPDSYRVEGRKERYISESRPVRVAGGETTEITLRLPPVKKVGRLSVIPTPRNARVRIMNIVPPYEDGMELKPGEYHVRVDKPGYETVDRQVVLAAGEKLEEEIELPEIPSGPGSDGTWTEPVTGMEFVWVEGGCYEMGSNHGYSDEKPVHEVCVDGIWMGKYEVTIEQYRKFLQVTGDTGGVDWDDDDCPIRKGGSYSLSRNILGSDGDQPMVEVSWHGAKAFADWLSRKSSKDFRLPTEAEWEYAARSGGKREKYAGGNNVDRIAWYASNSGGRTHEVGTKAPNGLGLYDMSGNVLEWCADWYDSDAYSQHSRNNPIYDSGGSSSRVWRGGSWGSNPSSVRCAKRSIVCVPGYTVNVLGFRLLRTR